jgi:hypothetical protein
MSTEKTLEQLIKSFNDVLIARISTMGTRLRDSVADQTEMQQSSLKHVIRTMYECTHKSITESPYHLIYDVMAAAYGIDVQRARW